MIFRPQIIAALIVLTGCEDLPEPAAPVPAPAGAEAPPPRPVPPDEIAGVVSAPLPPPGARTVAELDTTTEAQKAAAREAAATGGGEVLGTTIASLGDPTEPGLWLKTPLVREARTGRVETADGTSALVQLIPLDAPAGAGSQMSIAAFQALGLTLTDLPELIVHGA